MPDRGDPHALDAADPLASLRDRFVVPSDVTYLDGNSLGALPARTAERLRQTVEREWGVGLVGSWNASGWIDAARRVGDAIGPLIGADEGEVICADSTSANLFKLLLSARRARPARRVILTEPGNFPTDLYVAQGVAWSTGDMEVRTVPAERLVDAVDEDVSAVMLSHVHYRSGRRHDMASITAAAHAKGALAIWDLSHSAGAIAVDLNGCGVDLAVGCGYKYLNGGPGAPSFLFVARRHQRHLRSPLSGWFGHAAPFAFEDDYVPADDIGRFQCGTPPILALAALEEGVATFAGVDLPALWAKGEALCAAFVGLMEERCARHGLTLATPRDPASRGSHLSYVHEDAHAICQALIARGVVGDFRTPDLLRFGFAPLYTRFADIAAAVTAVDAVMTSGAWRDERFQRRAAVT